MAFSENQKSESIQEPIHGSDAECEDFFRLVHINRRIVS